jgi:hypothetical protein
LANAFSCPVCFGENWIESRRISSYLPVIPRGLTRPSTVRVTICKCQRCGLEFNHKLLEGKDFQALYTNNSIYTVTNYSYRNGVKPKYTIDPIQVLELYRKPPGRLLEIGFLDTSSLEEFSKRGCQVGKVAIFATMVEKKEHEVTLWAGNEKSFRLITHFKTKKANQLWREAAGYSTVILPEGIGCWPYLFLTPIGTQKYANSLLRINLEKAMRAQR